MAVVTAMVTHRNSSSSSRILCSGCGPFPPLGLSCLFSCFPSLRSYAQKLPHHLRLLEEEEDEEDEDHLLRFVLPPFVWSLCSTAQAPKDEELLGDEDHKLEPALRSPPGALCPQLPCP